MKRKQIKIKNYFAVEVVDNGVQSVSVSRLNRENGDMVLIHFDVKNDTFINFNKDYVQNVINQKEEKNGKTKKRN